MGRDWARVAAVLLSVSVAGDAAGAVASNKGGVCAGAGTGAGDEILGFCPEFGFPLVVICLSHSLQWLGEVRIRLTFLCHACKKRQFCKGIGYSCFARRSGFLREFCFIWPGGTTLRHPFAVLVATKDKQLRRDWLQAAGGTPVSGLRVIFCLKKRSLL